MVFSDDGLTSDGLRDLAKALRNGEYDEKDFESDEAVEKRIAELEDEAARRADAEARADFWKKAEAGINPWDGTEGYDTDENL